MTVTSERVAYLLLIDGVSTAFADDEAVALAYVQTLGEFTAMHYGLQRPRSLADTLDLASGMLADSSATITIDDVDGTLAALFGSDLGDADELLTELEPTATAQASEWGKHVGVELIGPAGERRQCSCVPGWNIGEYHASAAQAWAWGADATPVTDDPRLWTGRRLALYRLVQDSAGDWPVDVSSSLVWWGTLLGRGTPTRRSWALRAAGRESWAYGTIGAGLPKEPLRVRGLTTLSQSEGTSFMRASLAIAGLHDETVIEYIYEDQLTDSAALDGLSTYADVASGVDAFLASLASTSGFDAFGASSLSFVTAAGQDGITVRWSRAQDINWSGGPWASARLILQLHEDAWRILGYEPSVQNSDRDPVDNEDQYGQFSRAAEWLPGVWNGKFWAANARAIQAMERGDTSDTEVVADDYVNGEWPRRWPPIYPGGCQVLTMQPGQELQIVTLDPLYLPSSLAVPLMAALDSPTSAFTISDGVGEVTHQGLMMMRGPYRRSTDLETAKAPAGYAFGIERERVDGRTVQVARVCWRENADGSVARDSAGYPRVAVYEWCDPRLYGIDYDRLTGTWASWIEPPEDGLPTTARPLLVLEHGRGPDSVPLVLAQLLASTGGAVAWYTDSGWLSYQYGLGGAPDLEVGPNDLALGGWGDERLGLWTDAQPARVGRRIPASLIAGAPGLQGSLADAISGLADADLARCKVTSVEPTSSRKLIAELLAPLGWAMSLAGGRFGLFDPWTFRAPTSAGIVTIESYAGKPGDFDAARPQQDLRELSPIDRLDVSAVRDPSANTFARVMPIAATDSGAPYRAQTMPRALMAGFLVHPQAEASKGPDWKSELIARWSLGFRFWASAHYKVTFTVPAWRASEFEVGSIVSLTDEQIVSPAGVYGVASAPGFVVARSLSPYDETAQVQALISADTLIQYAPAFVCTRYDADEDGEGYRLFAEADAFGSRDGSTVDVGGFAEPAFSDAGGSALIEGFAFDGVSWSRGIYGTVQSVDTDNSIVHLTGALTGATYYRDRWHVFVLRDQANQSAAWVDEVFAPLCDKDGTAGGSLGRRFTG
jgi:hypothetical protein